MEKIGSKLLDIVKGALPGTVKTCIWVVKLTVGVSFCIMLLRYLQILPWISALLEPVFHVVGLPGEAALAYVTGYFVNVYSAIAVSVTLDLSIREMTILSAMVLCAHNMLVETAVQKKTGTPAVRIVIYRTLSSILVGLALNLVIPAESAQLGSQLVEQEQLFFWPMLKEWIVSTAGLVVKMVAIIFSLNILQRILSEFGVINWISRFLKPLLLMFGLPPQSSFLWIIANVVGLAYGAAAMIDEASTGKLSQKDVDLTNYHICISHSNLEDVFLLASVGAVWWILIISRWIMSIILVWGYRFEQWIRNKFVPLQTNI
jgi:hypothetical protein